MFDNLFKIDEKSVLHSQCLKNLASVKLLTNCMSDWGGKRYTKTYKNCIFVLSFGNMNEYSKYSKPSKSEKVFIFKCICTEILNAVSLQFPHFYLIFKVGKYLSLHESFSSQKPNTNIGPESSIPWRCIVWNDERGLWSLPLWTSNPFSFRVTRKMANLLRMSTKVA